LPAKVRCTTCFQYVRQNVGKIFNTFFYKFEKGTCRDSKLIERGKRSRTRQTKRDRETQRKIMKSSKIGFPDYRARDRDKDIERNRDRQAGDIQRLR